ncbi:MAG: universal stress protein [Candidatus Thermoplasmatota archaeon]
MDKILVCFDGSEGSKKALNKAMNLMDENGTLFLLAVIESFDEDKFIDRDMHEKLKTKASEMIEGVVGDMGEHGFDFKGLVEEGSPSEVIIDFSNRLDVDLIMIGRRGHGKLGRFVIGGVASRVVQYANKPVMVVR